MGIMPMTLIILITTKGRMLGVTRTNLSNIANEKSDIRPEMVYRISIVFGGSAEIWANLQTKFDLSRAEKKVRSYKLKPYRPDSHRTVHA